MGSPWEGRAGKLAHQHETLLLMPLWLESSLAVEAGKCGPVMRGGGSGDWLPGPAFQSHLTLKDNDLRTYPVPVCDHGSRVTPRSLSLDLVLQSSLSHFPLVPLRNRTWRTGERPLRMTKDRRCLVRDSEANRRSTPQRPVSCSSRPGVLGLRLYFFPSEFWCFHLFRAHQCKF